MKKRILSAFLVLCMMLTMVPTAALAAEDPGGGNGSDRVHTESNDGVVVDKTVNYDEDGNYSLTLEAYVTNEVTKGSKTTPLDIVLVLDVSGSMDDDLGESTWEYTPTDEQRWSYSDINGSRWTTYYFRDDDGNYYEVEAESDGSWGTGNIPSGIIPALVLPGLESARYYQQEPECQPLDRYSLHAPRDNDFQDGGHAERCKRLH